MCHVMSCEFDCAMQAQRKTEKAKHQQDTGNLQTRLLGTTRRLVYATDQLTLSKDKVKECEAYINRLECQLVQVHRAKAGHKRQADKSRPRSACRSTTDVQVQCDLLQGAVRASAASSQQRDGLRHVAARLGVCNLLDSVEEEVCGHVLGHSPSQSASTQPTPMMNTQKHAHRRMVAANRFGGQSRRGAHSTPPQRGGAAAALSRSGLRAATGQSPAAPQRSASPALPCSRRCLSAAPHRSAGTATTEQQRQMRARANAGFQAQNVMGTPVLAPSAQDGAVPRTARPRDVYADPDTVATSSAWLDAGAATDSFAATGSDWHAGMLASA